MQDALALSLLIVDDEAEIRKGLMNAIPWEKHHIRLLPGARDGQEALTLIRKYHPDAVLTDIRMPVMDGLSLVKAAWEEQINTSFIILSGYDDFSYAKTAMKYGVREYLLKPIVMKDLLDALQAIRRETVQKQTDFKQREMLLQTALALGARQIIPELLQSTIEKKELEEALLKFRLPVRNAPCRVVLMHCRHVQENEDALEEAGGAAAAAFVKTVEECLKPYPCLLSEQNDGRLLVVFNMPFPGDLVTCLEEVSNRIMRDTPYRVTVAVGDEAASLLDLPSSYRQALQLISWRIYPKLRPVLTKDMIPEQTRQAALEQLDTQPVLDAVLQAKARAITDAVYDVWQQLFYIPTPPPHYLFGMCNYIIVDLQNKIPQYIGSALGSFLSDSYMTLSNLEDICQIRDWLTTTLIGFGNEIASIRSQKLDPVIEKAISYIQKHIFENVRIEELCAFVGLSKTYFTAYFKSKTQQNFRDYVLNQKILYAQEQLKKQTCSLAELADVMGYEDYRSFNRAFKARTGFAPSEYRQKYVAGHL